MKSQIEIMFDMQERLFNGQYDPLEFSHDMEIFFYDHYDEIVIENAEIARIYNEDLPELCAEAEPNFDPKHMINGIRDEYERAKAIFNKRT